MWEYVIVIEYMYFIACDYVLVISGYGKIEVW